MPVQILPIKDSYHFYHKGVQSRPAWAYNEARRLVIEKYVSFMKSMPDTAHVVFQDQEAAGDGGKTSRLGTWTNISVTGAGSKDTNVFGKGRKWETWFDLHYEITFYFVSADEEAKVKMNEATSVDDINEMIRKGTGGVVH